MPERAACDSYSEVCGIDIGPMRAGVTGDNTGAIQSIDPQGPNTVPVPGEGAAMRLTIGELPIQTLLYVRIGLGNGGSQSDGQSKGEVTHEEGNGP